MEQLTLWHAAQAKPDLSTYDHIIINSSAGKDSQTMLDVVWSMATQQGIPLDRLLVVHADLGRAEWQGTRQLAEQQAEAYGLKFVVVSRPQGDLIDRIKDRGRWPSPAQRYCTSDLKRNQIARIIRNLCPTGRVLNCMGLRAQESSARAKKSTFTTNKYLTTQRRGRNEIGHMIAGRVEQAASSSLQDEADQRDAQFNAQRIEEIANG